MNIIKPEIILKLNEYFHDLEALTYDSRHLEIFAQEKKNWPEILKTVFSEDKNNIFLDYGSGTGFVEEVIYENNYQNKVERFYCYDISQEMLNKAQEKFKEKKEEFVWHKINSDENINLSESVDIACLNSVLHHLAEPKKVLLNILDNLKSGGYLVLEHEPNKKFYSSKFVFGIFKILRSIKNIFSKKVDKKLVDITMQLNQRMIQENLIKEPFSYQEIQRYVDFQVPASFGKLNKNVGFSPQDIVAWLGDTVTVEKSKTYSFYNIKLIDMIFNKIFKSKGKLFYLILKKK